MLGSSLQSRNFSLSLNVDTKLTFTYESKSMPKDEVCLPLASFMSFYLHWYMQLGCPMLMYRHSILFLLQIIFRHPIFVWYMANCWKIVKISWFDHNEWFGICATYFKYGIDEMMRNASCFVIWILVNNWLHFPK